MGKAEVNNDISLIDFPNICRICLSMSTLSLFDKSKLLDLFKNITNIEILPDDNLPQHICIACINQLESIGCFINLSKNSNTKLKNILTKNDSKFEDHIGKLGSDSDDGAVEPPEFPYKSEIFEESVLNTKNQLDKHQKKNVNCKTKKYKCTDCEKNFSTKLRLNLHMRSHTTETAFECKICFKKFRHNKNLKRHDDIVHKKLKPFKCDVCGKDFATSLRRTEHLRVHTGERPHICTYCGVGFKKYSTRYAHEIRHKIKNGEIPKSDKQPKKYPRKIPDDPAELECDICKKSFSSKQARWVHAQIHKGEKSFLCNVCGKGFLRKNHLEVHVRIHTGEKPYKCNDCGKYFRQASSYRSHLLIHKGEKSYKCEICLRTFIQLGHLKSHLHTHSGEKPYKCTFCGKGFSQNVNLKSHTRIHTGERPYQCFICYMGFYDSKSYKKHEKKHGAIETGDPLNIKKEDQRERPYQCFICHMSFYDIKTFQKHEGTHENIETGDTPEKTHRVIDTGDKPSSIKGDDGTERPYQCFICYMGFYDSTSFKMHEETHGVVEEKVTNGTYTYSSYSKRKGTVTI